MSDDSLRQLLAEQLRTTRENCGLSQTEAGLVIFRSGRKIRFVESGEQVPDLIEFLRLMEAYNMPPEQFLAKLNQLWKLQEMYEANQPVATP